MNSDNSDLNSLKNLNHKSNLYNILEIQKNASYDEIRKSYRKLALKWHPDKNIAVEAREKFNHIKIAYDILSNKESRDKYDALNENQHNNLLNVICNFVKSIINPVNINKLINIICDNDIYMMNEIKNMETFVSKKTHSVSEYDKLKEKIEQRLKNKIDLEYINNFMHSLLTTENKLNTVNLDDINLSIFFGPNEIIPEKNYNLLQSNDLSNINSDYSDKSRYTTNTTEMDIYGEIKTTLDEIYSGISKDITVNRQIIDKSNTLQHKLIFKSYKYNVPLHSDQIIFENQGDEYYDETNNIKSGKLIIDIKCKKHKYFKRVNENDILVSLPLTLYELFNGFNKTFDYFNNDNINLMMPNGFQKIRSNKNIFVQSKFDGQKIIVTLNNYGLLNDTLSDRGNLIIYLVLIKKDKFNDILKTHFE